MMFRTVRPGSPIFDDCRERGLPDDQRPSGFATRAPTKAPDCDNLQTPMLTKHSEPTLDSYNGDSKQEYFDICVCNSGCGK
jgi:hypothetical protein